MSPRRGLVDAGVVKLGCLMGDHVKTGIGTLLTTGTVVGAGSNLFGGLMSPKSVPAFSWGVGGELEEYDLDKFLDVAERVMARREVALTPESRALPRKPWEQTRPAGACGSASSAPVPLACPRPRGRRPRVTRQGGPDRAEGEPGGSGPSCSRAPIQV